MFVTWEYRLMKLDRISDYRNKWGAPEPTQPPIQLVPMVKRPGLEAEQLSPTSAEVKKTGIYISIPP
jgi:hypothetical protein